MVATVTASYFLLTADYGPEPNVLDPVSLFYFFFNCFGFKVRTFFICSLIMDEGIVTVHFYCCFCGFCVDLMV